MLVIFVMEWMGKKFKDFSTVGNWDVMICFESMGFNKKIIETKYLKVLKIHIKKLCNIKQRSKLYKRKNSDVMVCAHIASFTTFTTA